MRLVGSRNLYRHLSALGVKHTSLPVHLKFNAAGIESNALLTFKYGVGDFLCVARVKTFPSGSWGLERHAQGKIISIPFHLLLKEFLIEARGNNGGHPLRVTRLVVSRLLRAPRENNIEFAYVLEEWSTLDLDLVTQQKAKKRKGEPKPWMPFGMSFDGPDGPAPPPSGPEHPHGLPAGGGPAAADGEFGAESDASDLGGESIIPECASSDDGGSRSEPESDGGPGPDEPPVGPCGDAAPPCAVAGLIGYGIAPTNRAVCGICGKPIEKGTWRVEHRMTNTLNADNMWNVRRIHIHCVPSLPAELKRANFLIAQDWSSRPGLSLQEQEVLDELADMLRDGHGASSGSGLPPGA